MEKLTDEILKYGAGEIATNGAKANAPKGNNFTKIDTMIVLSHIDMLADKILINGTDGFKMDSCRFCRVLAQLYYRV